jgi:hypothetical protein
MWLIERLGGKMSKFDKILLIFLLLIIVNKIVFYFFGIYLLGSDPITMQLKVMFPPGP